MLQIAWERTFLYELNSFFLLTLHSCSSGFTNHVSLKSPVKTNNSKKSGRAVVNFLTSFCFSSYLVSYIGHLCQIQNSPISSLINSIFHLLCCLILFPEEKKKKKKNESTVWLLPSDISQFSNMWWNMLIWDDAR